MSIAEATELIIEDADAILKRLIKLADGELAEITADGTRIYSAPPDLITIRYLMDRALGDADVRLHQQQRLIDNWTVTIYMEIAQKVGKSGGADKILAVDGPLRVSLNGWIHRQLRLAGLKRELEKILIDYLPTCIDRLAELCNGVTVRTIKTKSPRKSDIPSEHPEPEAETPESTSAFPCYPITIITDVRKPPCRRAINYLLKRMGGGEPAIAERRQLIPIQPERTMDITPEQQKTINELPGWVRQICYNKEKKSRSGKPRISSLFDKRTGELRADVNIPLPDHYLKAWKRLTHYVKPAISKLKILAEGAATTSVTTHYKYGPTDEVNTVDVPHKPDGAANKILIDRLFGSAKSKYKVPWNSIYDHPDYAQDAARIRENLSKRCGRRSGEAKTLFDSIRSAFEQIYPATASAF